jgi:HD-GYP domain-containing protein (c-di-GMP phosphodiesterase class II)
MLIFLEIPREYLDLSVKDMTPEQYEISKKHPELRYQIVENNRGLNHSVKTNYSSSSRSL